MTLKRLLDGLDSHIARLQSEVESARAMKNYCQQVLENNREATTIGLRTLEPEDRRKYEHEVDYWDEKYYQTSRFLDMLKNLKGLYAEPEQSVD